MFIFERRPICAAAFMSCLGIMMGFFAFWRDFRCIPLMILAFIAIYIVGKARALFALATFFIFVAYSYACLFVFHLPAQITGDIKGDFSGKVIHAVGGDAVLADCRINGKPIGAKVAFSTKDPIFSGDIVYGKCELFVPKEPTYKGGYDERIYSYSKGVSYKAIGKDLKISYSNVFAPLAKLRLKLEQSIEALFDDYDSALIRALIFGDTSLIDKNLYEAYSGSGLAHILAVSGLHVSILAGAIMWALKRFKLKGRLIVGVLLVCYVAMCMTVSVARASIMFILGCLAEAKGERYDSLTALSIAALIIMIINPLLIFTASFLMSFSCILGIYAFSPMVGRLLGWLPNNKLTKYIIGTARISIGAQLGLLPVQLMIFGFFTPYALVANILVAPIIPIAVICAMASAFLGLIAAIAAPSAVILSFSIQIINISALIIGKLPFSKIYLGAPDLFALFALIIGLTCLGAFVHSKKAKLIGAWTCAIMLCCSFSISWMKYNTIRIIMPKDGSVLIMSKGESAIINPKYSSASLINAYGVTKLKAAILKQDQFPSNSASILKRVEKYNIAIQPVNKEILINIGETKLSIYPDEKKLNVTIESDGFIMQIDPKASMKGAIIKTTLCPCTAQGALMIFSDMTDFKNSTQCKGETEHIEYMQANKDANIFYTSLNTSATLEIKGSNLKVVK